MKKHSLLILATMVIGFLQAQNTISLNLTHLYNGQDLSYTQNYTDPQQPSIKITSTRYYLSSIKITHDGGQLTNLEDVYILGEGNVSDYAIDGSYSINSIEKIEFDLGVDYYANHGNTSNYPPQHPLGPKTPPMDWGWPSGYFFIVLHGKVDDNNDGTPNQLFQIESFGDQLLRSVDPIEFPQAITPENNHFTIPLFVNIERWFSTMPLTEIGINHGANAENITVADNTNDYNVFTAINPHQTDLTEQKDQLAFITTDYNMPYAPVLFYKLPKSSYTLSIYDMKGKKLLSEKQLNYEGNYFLKSELKSGMYIAVFNSEYGAYRKTHPFTVTR